MIAPTLHTERLTLRMPRLEDFEPRASFYASERSVWEGGPLSRVDAWRIWASEVGLWPLRGYGPFTVEAGGAYIGEVGIYQAEDYPGPELGWFVLPEAEGRGYALGVGEVKLTGMVRPDRKMLTYKVDFTKALTTRRLTMGVANGIVEADGEVIYQVTDMKVALSAT